MDIDAVAMFSHAIEVHNVSTVTDPSDSLEFVILNSPARFHSCTKCSFKALTKDSVNHHIKSKH